MLSSEARRPRRADSLRAEESPSVTAARLAIKMRKLREEHEEEEVENGELNLVPYLDIVTNVIMFLMMTTTYAAQLADINVSAPTVARSADPGQMSENNQQDLNLTVSISEKGVTIAAAGAVLYQNDIAGRLPTIPKDAKGEHDFATLTRKMRQIKDKYGNETKVIINANPDITYEIVVATMDAIRRDTQQKELFPDVLLAAGVN
jgi:biopolymer transport protein TolR